MSGETNTQHYPRWMPTAGGVISIVAGSLGLVGSIFLLVFSNVVGSDVVRQFYPSSVWQNWGWPVVIVGIAAVLFIIIDLLAIVGGIFAVLRRNWGWALAGGICAVLASRLLGIFGLVFIALSRKEFE
jgi:hypothetical protein